MAPLSGTDKMTRYFNKLLSILSVLLDMHQKMVQQGSQEYALIEELLKKFLRSVLALRMKHRFSDEAILIDLTRSGFPNYLNFTDLLVDMASKEETLKGMQEQEYLRRQMLDVLLQGREPEDLLVRLGQRAYLDMIGLESHFFPFTPGRVVKVGEGKDFLASWGTFDYQSNRPFIYSLILEPGPGAEAKLDEPGEMQDYFWRIMREETSGIGPTNSVRLLHMMVDERLKNHHPKILKRTCIGPLHVLNLCNDHEAWLDDLFKAGVAGRRILLEFDVEISVAEKEVVGKDSAVKQIIFLPADAELRERDTSVLHKNILLPHELLQMLGERMPDCRRFSYDMRGNIYGI